ncbi:hypothetical protein MHC_04690 [Mycoplasma haemocanis str. Illinois]|uniref:Uncharacterized protein n=1 Tax=Mycoplasma haemocanis (strain Illinois) TaxID=1111676 RepID=H6N822_MYCHN|nr:hypothetical protein [Mycoplasma haemocanis]AEW45794.1 hypothetical protein MHC_04690 [Mycoplasma haemocanis str. Illinois]
MSSIFKLTFLVAGTTATAGLGIAASKGLFSSKGKKESISSLLSKNPSNRVIGVSEEDNWKKSWKSYKESNKDFWKLGNLVGESPDAFKSKCKERLDLKVSGVDSEEYQNFLKYCSRKTLVSDLIGERNPNKEIITTDTATDQSWVASWGSYIDDSRNKQSSGGTNIWNLSDWGTTYSQKNQVPASFIAKCKSNVSSPSHDILDPLYLDTLKFCTKDKASSHG